MAEPVRITILGAAGLIGGGVAEALHREGFPVIAVARRFTPAQAVLHGPRAVTRPVVALDAAALADLIAATRAEIVVNAVGILQDGPGGATRDVHGGFARRLVQALSARERPCLLVQVSVPGTPAEDLTDFSRTKREAEAAILRDCPCFVILRPGFVIAPAAYGGSALVRALAALPVRLPGAVAARPFGTTALADIAGTIAVLARRWEAGERDWRAVLDPIEAPPPDVGTVVEAFRRRFGGPAPRLTLPAPLLRAGARAGDAVARLGWSPPVRTTALAEMRRGVAGDPRGWTAATGLAPTGLEAALAALPATVQERWFARLFLLKPLVIGGLAAFWLVSGLVALLPAFAPAAAILTAHGLPGGLARALTAATALADIAVGVAIARRRTCRAGLRAGLALALGYLAGAVVVAPDLWLDPLGSLVKVIPILILTGVALAILEER
ncbi:SDR family oxidoreductase [Methylobacterium sp. JK268]